MIPAKALRIVLASGNAHKAEELAKLVVGFPIVSATGHGGMPCVDETESTFAGNARLKALALRRIVSPEHWVLADDSGLEVDALEGAPGVLSARYAGPEANDAANRVKLLGALAGMPSSMRSARFRCTLCLIDGGGNTFFFDGTCEGRIAKSECGDNGFGYDSLFIPNGYSNTFGELPAEVKALLSHRAKAADELSRFLQTKNYASPVDPDAAS